MKNFRLLMAFALCLTFGLSYGQIKVIANGDVGVGHDFPLDKLDVLGTVRIDGDDAANGTYSQIFDSGPNLNLSKYRPTGGALIDLNPIPLDSVGNAKFRFFRQTHTTGNCSFDLHWGDGSSSVNSSFSGNGDTFLNKDFGNVSIGTSMPDPAHKLQVAGTICAQALYACSDKRLKTEAKDFEHGLDVVLQMQPMTYRYNGKANLDTRTTHIGVMAQDLQQVAPYLVGEFTHYETDPENNVLATENYLKIHDSEIKYLLVNAIKEQNTQIKETETQIKDMEVQIKDLQTQVAQLVAIIKRNDTSSTQTINVSTATLAQNAPNPFNQSTTIHYTVPTDAMNATLQIFDLNGSMLKRVSLVTGNGQVTINAGELAAGTYSYNLIVDDTVIDSKKMILTK